MASIPRACRLFQRTQLRKIVLTRGFRTTGQNAAAKNFNMPAMSPTMTEGGIASWKVKEGDKFKAGDVLLEIETDKAQIDVEAQDDGIVAKIFAENGTKGIAVGSRIAVLAEPSDDLSTLKIPDAPQAKSTTPQESKTAEEPNASPSPPPPSEAPAQPASPSKHEAKKHHRPSKEPFTPSPSVLAVLHRNHLTKEDIPKIPTTGPRGRLLKGDVLAYVGTISKDSPSAIESVVEKLAHLDLSNIKVKQAPAPERKEEISASKKGALSTQPLETDIQVEISLEKLSKFQGQVQAQLGFSPPVSAFLVEASRKASQQLPPSKLPPTPTELFNDLIGVQKKAISKAYQPQITSLPPPSAPSPKKVDIIDILSSHKPKPAVHRVSSATAPTPLNVISVKVKKEDETRGRVFLDRVKGYIEDEPEKLFASWGEGIRKQSSAELF